MEVEVGAEASGHSLLFTSADACSTKPGNAPYTPGD